MICFLAKRSTDYTIRNYVRRYAEGLAKRIILLNYESLSVVQKMECSAVIFLDIDRLNQRELKQAEALQHFFEENYPDVILFNKPDQVLLRYDFLKALHQGGINPHNVYRISELPDEINYPVFLREENEHSGTLTSLVWNSKELDVHALGLHLQGFDRRKLLAVEYVDVSSDSQYLKKYSVTRIGSTFIPRQIDYTTTWQSKDPNLEAEKSSEYAQDYLSFMNSDQHYDSIKQAFELARIEYGRIDFGFANGVPVIWEINLNPDFGPPPYEGELKETLDSMYDRLRSAFSVLADRPTQTIDTEEMLKKLSVDEPAPADDKAQKETLQKKLYGLLRRMPYKNHLISAKRSLYLFMAQCWIRSGGKI